MKKLVGLVALLWATSVFAEPKTADEWYKEGENQYILGEYDKAAEAFKRGFEIETVDSKKPAYIYNVAQAYRQAKKCTEAVFFYRRFLQLKDSGMGKPLTADRRSETEQLITEAEGCAKSADATAKKPPDGTMKPDGTGKTGTGGVTTTGTGTTGTGMTTTTGTGTTTTGTGTTTTGTGTTGTGTTTTTTTTTHKPDVKVAKAGGEGGEGDDDDEGIRRRTTVEPKVLDARFSLGGAKISAGPADVPIQMSFALVGGYPIKINEKLRVYPGAALTFTPIPYKNPQLMNAQSNATFTELLANGGATYEIMPKLSLRGDLGLGVLFFGGIQDAGNPFTLNAQSTTGTLAMFAVRVAASADYEINKNLFATATPFAFSYSPAKEGLNATALSAIDFMIGVGYRM